MMVIDFLPFLFCILPHQSVWSVSSLAEVWPSVDRHLVDRHKMRGLFSGDPTETELALTLGVFKKKIKAFLMLKGLLNSGISY